MSVSTDTDNPTTTTTNTHPLQRSLLSKLDYSWISRLSPEDKISNPDSNNVKRPVKNGHYVLVTPRPLRKPRLVIHSQDLAEKVLGFGEDEIKSDEFVKFFSGDVRGAVTGGHVHHSLPDPGSVPTWATPYALSIMGTRYTNNCPFGTGEGYGDGRAISVAEIVLPDANQRWEFQLKGAGPTPFCRGADGRAVLRSSVREFLASEAMHHLGVATTRALSLIVSEGGDTSQRPWYRESFDKTTPVLPDIDDPRLAVYPLEKRRELLAHLARQKRDPDVMVEEPNAITCRVSPSFVRIGHLDLFARRLPTTDPDRYDRSSREYRELEQMVRHACFRDLPGYDDAQPLAALAHSLLLWSAQRLALMVSHWIRVGFVQGNFNADNCLVAGRTMDYGPFGFVDRYDPYFAKWTGSGQHFGFLNQPNAALVNYQVLVESVLPVILPEDQDNVQDKFQTLLDTYMTTAQEVFEKQLESMWRSKLGLSADNDADADELWSALEPILRQTQADWTIFWRQLYHVARDVPLEDPDYQDKAMTTLLQTDPFYQPLTDASRANLSQWLTMWRAARQRNNGTDTGAVLETMRTANPKYTLKEWMLVRAYTQAQAQQPQPDFTEIHRLMELVERPYDEGTAEQHAQYYRKATDDALQEGGTAFMS